MNIVPKGPSSLPETAKIVCAARYMRGHRRVDVGGEYTWTQEA